MSNNDEHDDSPGWMPILILIGLIALAIGLIIAAAGCSRVDVPKDREQFKFTIYANTFDVLVYGVKIDGKEYIVAKSAYGIAITPKQ